MAELKKYDITTETGFTTTLLLSEEDAKSRGLIGAETETKKAPAPQNKQAKPASGK